MKLRNPFLQVVLCLGAAFSLVTWAQQRVVTYDAQTVVVDRIQLEPRPDGGCAARWCGQVVSSEDGGATQRECTAQRELTASNNVNRCNQLANAGLDRLRKEFDFDVDAGAQ